MKIAAPSGRRIQSLDRAFALLGQLADHPAGLGLSELAAGAGLSPQTAQSLIRTLQAHGWVSQNGRGQPYRLGPAPAQLAARRLGGDALAADARDLVAALCRDCGEHVLLAELTGPTPSAMLEIQGNQALTVGRATFEPARLHVMATAQVLMAFLAEEAQERLVAGLSMHRCGPRSLTTHAALRKRLAEIRRQGFVVCRDEAGEYVSALAAPVHGADGQVRAALGISLPTVRLTAARQQTLLRQLRAAASEIAARWGWTEG